VDLSKATKYLADRIFGAATLALATPLILVLCVLIRLESRGNPLALKERVGARGRTFTMFRFRVSRLAAHRPPDATPISRPDEGTPAPSERTRLGRFLCWSRLESLPQLINVVLGEMSFVGPFAALRGETESYTPRQARRLMFRPGLTGWAQIHAPAPLTTRERIALDLFYCERFSSRLDTRILWHALWRTQPRTSVAPGAPPGTTPALHSDAQLPAPDRLPAPTPGVERAARGTGRRHPTASASGTPIVVIGTGGHARVVLDAIEMQQNYEVLGLLADPKASVTEPMMYGYRVLGGEDVLQHPETPRRAIVALGSGRARESWFAKLEAHGYDIVPVVHPGAHVGRDVELGAGAVVLAGAVVNSGVRLGRGVLVRAGSTLDHDCRLDDFAHVAPGAHLAGDVHVGARSHIGIGACVVPGIQIGSDVLVGAGAVVTQSVPRGYTIVGTPGRTMRRPDLPRASARPRHVGVW